MIVFPAYKGGGSGAQGEAFGPLPKEKDKIVDIFIAHMNMYQLCFGYGFKKGTITNELDDSGRSAEEPSPV